MTLYNASGNFAAFIAAGLFGASVVATRVAVQEIPPLNLTVLCFGQGGLILFLCLLSGATHLLKFKRHDLPFLVLLGVILFAIFPVTLNISLRLTEAFEKCPDACHHAYMERVDCSCGEKGKVDPTTSRWYSVHIRWGRDSSCGARAEMAGDFCSIGWRRAYAPDCPLRGQYMAS
jgi:hypothetical protein